MYTVYWNYMRTTCFGSIEKTDMSLGVYLEQQCSVHCLLELYADHMFITWNICDPGCVI